MKNCFKMKAAWLIFQLSSLYTLTAARIKPQEVFSCTFEDDACGFELIEPDDLEQFHWYRTQDVTLSNGHSIFDHTYGDASSEGTIMFASGGSADSKTIVEISSSVACPMSFCCINAYALMSKAESPDAPGSVAFYVMQDIAPGQMIATVISNSSFTSFNNFWSNIQYTFHADSKPFRIGIETRNGGGGREFFVAVDDITVTAGICNSDERIFGEATAKRCGEPPSVLGGYSVVSRAETPGAVIEATYICNPGYELIGPTVSSCLLNGEWSTAPVCSPFQQPTYLAPRREEGSETLHELLAEERVAGKGNLSKSQNVDGTLIADCMWGDFFGENVTVVAPLPNNLYLFPENPITCSGRVYRWDVLVPDIDATTGFYLSVWRPVKRGLKRQYKLVGFNQLTGGHDKEIIQFVVPGNERYDIKEGDIMGLIFKQTSSLGAVAAYDVDNPPPGGVDRLYVSISGDLHIEDLSIGDLVSDAELNRIVNLMPLLRAYIGSDECTEKMFSQVSFGGDHTDIPGVVSQQGCFDYCRKQPSCFAISFDAGAQLCHFFTYISEEIEFATRHVSMTRSCHDECLIKLLSYKADNSTYEPGDDSLILSFDITINEPNIPLPVVPKSIGECELACRYKPKCTAFSYDNPFHIGSCQLYENATRVIATERRRSFRKIGCEKVRPHEECQQCLGWYQCKEGLTCMLYGDNGESRCLANPSTVCHQVVKSHPDDDLEANKCPDPPIVQKGYVAEYKPDSDVPTVTYACNSGYELLGSPKVWCIGLSWQAPIPFCRPACRILPNVENGHVEEVLERTVAKQVTVRCNRGYRIVGSSVVACVNTSRWSKVPACIPECGTPPSVRNAYMMVVKGSASAPTAVRYTCNPGFTTVGNNDSVQCTGEKTWSPAPPTCQPVASCPTPPPLTNGAILNTTIFGSKKENAIAIYGCLSGFELVGKPMIYCRNNTNWEDLPYCAPACGELPTVTSSVARIRSHKNGRPTILQYECLPGFSMEGDSVVSCISALWTRPPKCAPNPNSLTTTTTPKPEPSTIVTPKPNAVVIPNYTEVPQTTWKWATPESDYSDDGTTAPPLPTPPLTCGNPPDIENGHWETLESAGNDRPTVGFSCDPGYNLIGPSRLVCVTPPNSKPMWQPAILPCCREPLDYLLNYLPKIILDGLPNFGSPGVQPGNGEPSLLFPPSVYGNGPFLPQLPFIGDNGAPSPPPSNSNNRLQWFQPVIFGNGPLLPRSPFDFGNNIIPSPRPSPFGSGPLRFPQPPNMGNGPLIYIGPFPTRPTVSPQDDNDGEESSPTETTRAYRNTPSPYPGPGDRNRNPNQPLIVLGYRSGNEPPPAPYVNNPRPPVDGYNSPVTSPNPRVIYVPVWQTTTTLTPTKAPRNPVDDSEPTYWVIRIPTDDNSQAPPAPQPSRQPSGRPKPPSQPSRQPGRSPTARNPIGGTDDGYGQEQPPLQPSRRQPARSPSPDRGPRRPANSSPKSPLKAYCDINENNSKSRPDRSMNHYFPFNFFNNLMPFA